MKCGPSTEIPDELIHISRDEIRCLLEGERRQGLRNQILWTDERREAYRRTYEPKF